MDQTPNLQLPYILPSQAQKHVTHNEALRVLDTTVQLSVESQGLSVPPDVAGDGTRYIVAPEGSGLWADRSRQIATRQDGGWSFIAPGPGWVAYVRDTQSLCVFTGMDWVDAASFIGTFDWVGINTAADATNRLAISADATLLTHDGADHRLAINKASASGTASVVFQTGHSGRGEIGLAGDDRIRIKASADGLAWTTAMLVQPDGTVLFPAHAFGEHFLFNLLHDGGRFAGSPENPSLAAGAFVAPGYLTSYNGSAFSAAGKYTHNSSTFGGTAAAVDGEIQGLIEKLKETSSARRYGPEFHALQVVAGNGTLNALTQNGTTRYLAVGNRPAPLPSRSTWGVNVRVISGSLTLALRADLGAGYVDGIAMDSDLAVSNASGWIQYVFTGTTRAAETPDYNATLFPIYATPGAVFLLALPFVSPGCHRPAPGDLIGRIAGIQSWR